MSDKCLTHVRLEIQMDRITIRLPPQQVEMLERLVEIGEFPSVSEAVRYAVRDFLSQKSDRIIRDSDSISTFDIGINC
jgi:Arc/MetJ-type ribon-helix-helix transcriptional regulator